MLQNAAAAAFSVQEDFIGGVVLLQTTHNYDLIKKITGNDVLNLAFHMLLIQ